METDNLPKNKIFVVSKTKIFQFNLSGEKRIDLQTHRPQNNMVIYLPFHHKG